MEKERQRDFLGTDVYEGVLKQKIEQLEAKNKTAESKPDQEIHPLAGFANAHEAARYIAENSEDESYRAIAGRISEFIGENVEYIIVQPDVEVPGGVPRALDIANGVNYENYKTGRRAIYLRGDKFNGENGMNETVVLHELIHAATAERINDGNKAKNKNTTLALPFKISISCSTVSPPT